MKFFQTLSVAALATLASSTAVNVNKRDSPLEVVLEKIGNTKVIAKVTNTGNVGLNLMNKGTILDSQPVQKLAVFAAEKQIAFDGILLRMQTTNLDSSVFTAIEAGQTIEVEIDAAELHDLSTTGSYDVTATGAIPYAEIGSTELSGSAVTFASNTLSMAVDGAEAAKVTRAIHKMKRTSLSTDCTGTKLTQIRQALTDCNRLATNAATAARSGAAAKFSEYFKTTSSTTRSTVAARLTAVARDCSSTTGGATTTHCTDGYGACSSNVLAYTVPSANYISYCNIFFTALPAVSGTCHAQDRATTVIHEETHAPGVYSPGTDDLGYGYAAATRLSANSALNNADQYALYSNAIQVGC